MYSAKVLSAVVAFGAANMVAAQTCTKDIEITQPTPVIDCTVVDADITISSDVAGALSIEGPTQLKGNLIISNATQLLSVSSSSIKSIGGRFELQNLELLNAVALGSLTSLNEIVMIKLPQLNTINFGTEGVTKASDVTVSDTFLNDLSGLSLATVKTLRIDNNRRLLAYNSDLVNITTSLIITDNGPNMDISMPELETAAEIQLQNVKSFDAPKLSTVDASLKLDKCPEFESFAAPNLTKVTNAVSFINNKKLANVSLPLLTSIGGDLTVLNNAALEEMDGFPALKTVAGGINLGGNFEKVELPSLEDVKGSVNVSSTTDIKDFCGGFNEAKDDSRIQGKLSCTSNNEGANEGEEGGEESSGSDSSNSDSTNGNAAGLVIVNTALLGLAAVAGVAQLL